MPMDESLRAQIETYLSHLDNLIRRGRQVRATLTADPSSSSAIAATRAWQEDCGVTVNQLSGGSKAHWLARSFSQAFLMRSASGHAVEGAAPAEIVQRLLHVLEQAVASLSGMEAGPGVTGSSSASPEAPPRRFEFVHNPELRPVVEQAYTASRRALDQGDYDLALRTACGILEAIVTDALEHKGLSALAGSDAPAEERLPIGRSRRGSPSPRERDSFAAGAPGCQPSRGRIEITPMPAARAARRRRFPSAMRDRPDRCFTS